MATSRGDRAVLTTRAAAPSLIAEALGAVATRELRLGNGPAIEAAAQRIGDAAYAFAERADGTRLAAIDDLLPPLSRYK